MDERSHDLYTLPDRLRDQDMYLLDLSEQCAHLEERLRDWMATLPQEQRLLLESYIADRDELDFQSVKRALRFGKNKGATL